MIASYHVQPTCVENWFLELMKTDVEKPVQPLSQKNTLYSKNPNFGSVAP
jgi:hypothetical protein